jgi:hypothetical protein
MIDVDLKKRDYTVEYENGPNGVIHLLGRTAGGTRVHLTNTEEQPYFYVPFEELTLI